MNNHLLVLVLVLVLVRLDPGVADGWSDEEVVRRWMAVYPPRTLNQDDAAAVRLWVADQLKDAKLVALYRQRLQDLGWFMKSLKEPLARMANKEDECKGTFWEARYKSIAILDEEALLATCVYIDLNPVAAGIAALLETSPHTSVRQPVRHAKQQGELSALKAASRGSAGSRTARLLEESHWLCPLEDLRAKGSVREGMLAGFSLGSYLLLLDDSNRLVRQGEARVSPEVTGIFDRLSSSPEIWNHRLRTMLDKSRLLGVYFTTNRDRLREIAAQRGKRHLDNAAPIGEKAMLGSAT